ncbi:hypothetical protein T439DRAFT_129680 [Meredithblackwellia eburnea MCA 4105]
MHSHGLRASAGGGGVAGESDKPATAIGEPSAPAMHPARGIYQSQHPSAASSGRIRSAMACTLCRKQKMKCEGGPGPCKR